MNHVRKHVLHDEEMRPVAVQIDYQDWLEIEKRLSPSSRVSKAEFVQLLNETRAIWSGGDGLTYQLKLRSECKR